jgi:hypothetical protein
MANPYRSGTPDLWYSGQLNDLWVEYKFVVLPKRETTYINFDVSPLQRRWIEHRRREHRNVWLIVGCSKGGAVFQGAFPDGMFSHMYLERVESVASVAGLISLFCHGGQACRTPNRGARRT